jgi:uncharacterized protein
MANQHGDFIWYELMTPDHQASEDFYGSVVGWKFGGDTNYRHIEASEGHVGGFLQLSPEMTAGGAIPTWIGYIKVADVDALVASIVADGGKVHMPARDMEDVGRMAMVTDPQGAPFYVMKPTPPVDRPDAQSLAFSYDRPRVGHCAWNELMTTDPAAAIRFYGKHFGWAKDGEMDMGELGKYEFLRHNGHAPEGSPQGHGMLGAVMPMVPGGAPVPVWTYYFRVPDIDAAIETIKSKGGKVLQEPIEIPGGDYSMVGMDPQGAAFALVGART